MAWSRPVLVRKKVEVISEGSRGGVAATGAGVGGGLIVALGRIGSGIRFRPLNSEPGTSISDASARSRQKLGALCWRGLSWPDGGLWARLLGLLGSEVLLGMGRPLVWWWAAASRGTGRVKDWTNVPGVLIWESRCSGV